MSKTKDILVDELAKQTSELVKNYTDDVKEAIYKEIYDLGRKGSKELREAKFPSGRGGTAIPSQRREWEQYASSWTDVYQQKPNYTVSTIHKSKHYQLTHLLEYGHATRDGKRTREFPHIKPISEELTKELLEKSKKIIEKGGKL